MILSPTFLSVICVAHNKRGCRRNWMQCEPASFGARLLGNQPCLSMSIPRFGWSKLCANLFPRFSLNMIVKWHRLHRHHHHKSSSSSSSTVLSVLFSLLIYYKEFALWIVHPYSQGNYLVMGTIPFCQIFVVWLLSVCILHDWQPLTTTARSENT